MSDTGRIISPKLAYDCLNAVPFSLTEALGVLDELRKYLAFYPARTYIEQNACPELDHPKVNVVGDMARIEMKIRNGGYKNAYSAYKDMMQIFSSFKDGHVAFWPVCVSGAFLFYHQYKIIMLAETPTDLPELYVADIDANGDGPFTLGKKIIAINGRKPSVLFFSLNIL